MITLAQSADQLKWSGAVWEFLFESALNLTFFDDVEMIAPVALMKHILTNSNWDHFETVYQFKFLVLF